MDKNKTAQTIAYETMRHFILNGQYKGGSKLKEAQLAEELQVSRTPIREAIRRLEQEGLIKDKRVLKPSASDIRHMFEMRILIEGYAASKAATYMVDDSIAEMRASIDRAKASNDAEEIISENKQFHDMIVREVRNPIMIETVDRMQTIIYMFSKTVVQHERPFLLEEHQGICEAIANRDVSGASHLMKAHLEADLEFVVNVVG